MRTRDRFGPWAITLTYVVFGALWILLSDHLLFRLFGGDAERLETAGTVKGWVYVLVTGALMYGLMSRRERAVAEQGRMLSSVLTNLGDAVVVCEGSGRVTALNPAARRLFGAPGTLSELEGWYAADGATRLPHTICPMARSVAGSSFSDLFYLKNPHVPEGRWFSVTGRPMPGRDGQVGGGVITCHDVTGSRLVEERLRATESMFRTVARLAPVAISRGDATGRVTYRSERWVEITGRTPSEGLGTYWTDAVHPDDREEVTRQWREAVRDQCGFRTEYRYRHLDGRDVWVLAQAEPELDAEGRLVGYVATLTDITALREAQDRAHTFTAQLEQRVRERTAELEASSRELAAFSSSVSHDLRAPLRTIAGFSSAVLEDHGRSLPEEARDHLRRVVAASRRMGEIIDSLLGLARVSRSELARTRVDLSALAASVIEELRVEEPGRVVDVHVAAGLSVYGDAGLLRIVVENLLSNAWKFTRRAAAARIEVTGERRDGETVVRVHDNGAGFEMDWSHKLFQPFERLHTVSEFPGSGIGLATVQRIVTRHGGRVWAEGRVGEGACFWFTLPEDVAAVEAAPKPAKEVVVAMPPVRMTCP